MNMWLDAVYYDRPDEKTDYTSDYFRRLNRSYPKSETDISEQIEELTSPPTV